MLQGTSRLAPAPDGRCVDEPGLAPVIGLLEVVAADDATVIGPFEDHQSHCLRADGSFFDGRFLFRNADGKTLRGRYFGRLEPTFNSAFGPPPGGPWLVLGHVCVSGGSVGSIANQCARGRYQPARGITNLSTGDATIFLDQTIEID